MMRQIKFRGKSIETGNWLYGNYIEKIKPTEEKPTFLASLIHDRALTAEEVYPDTVGQFTGLIDKNGKEIYEGDLLIFLDDHESDKLKPMNVFYDKDTASFMLTRNKYIFNISFKEVGYSNELEIIGNIFENPELLK